MSKTVLKITILAIAALASTAVMGSLYATGGELSLNITPVNFGGPAGALGRPATITALDPGNFTVPQGQAQKIAGMNLFDINNVSDSYRNRMTYRFILENPQDLSSVFNNPNAYLEVFVSDYTDPDIVYATTFVRRDKSVGTLRLSGVPSGTTQLKVRASVTVPGGRPPGQQGQILDMHVRLELARNS